MDNPADSAKRTISTEMLDLIRDRLKLLRFGTISLTVHDGQLVQMDVTEKRRFGH